jgi:2-dehydro-3-deoxyphosphogluconate aldolase/(4S)-4-hydroxy-2-oxoglutarate aldolase
MTKDEVRARIEEIGIIPAIRVSSADDALFAAESVAHAGIPVVEVTLTVPNAIEVVSALAQHSAEILVGAGTVLDTEMARRCLDAGAAFLTSPGLDPGLVEFAVRENVLVLPGALTPTEIMAAWKAGGDMIKVYPCGQVGGPRYIKAMRGPFPHVPLIASGGVNHLTAGEFILAGAAALGIGGDLIPREAIELRQPERIRELARRFLARVHEARSLRMEQ